MRLGLDPDAFWRQTPRTFERTVLGRVDMRRDAHRETAWAVWHTGVLPNVSGKKYPKLKEFMGTDEEGGGAAVEQKTPEQIRNVMTQWAFVKTDVVKGPRAAGRLAR